MAMNDELMIKMQCIVLDCENSMALAGFYSALLGWKIHDANPEWIGVSMPDELPYILFQQVSDYIPPVWPDASGEQRQMAHIDFVVSDLTQAVAHAVGCGAIKAEVQSSEKWTVMIDPAGHPFCLVQQRG